MSWSVVEVGGHWTIEIEAPDEEPVTLELAAQGLQGPPGPPGPAGDTYFVYDRAGVPAATWTITHGLGRPVHVTLLADDGAEVDTDITHPDSNTIVATFAAPTSGTAIVS